MDKKEQLILDDFSRRFLFEARNDLLGFLDGSNMEPKIVPVKIEEVYKKLYKDYPDGYKELFAYFHQSLNRLFDFMNYKMRGNRHYNAEQSRELIKILSSIEEFTNALYQVHTSIGINRAYGAVIETCKEFLSESGGSQIPQSLHLVHLERYDPIFEIARWDSTKVWQAESLRVTFSNDYMNKLINEMIASLGKDPARAISKAKNMLETCCKTILEDRGKVISKKADISLLVKDVREELKQEIPSSVGAQILGHISGIATSVARLRNQCGDGHGQNMNNVNEPSEIEAALAVDSSIAVVRFLWSLHQKQNSNAK